jgi:hypothetical protein
MKNLIESDLSAGKKFAGESCFLNGELATITGRKNDFALIIQKSTGLGCEFAWQTVERIMNSDKNFKSF